MIAHHGWHNTTAGGSCSSSTIARCTHASSELPFQEDRKHPVSPALGTCRWCCQAWTSSSQRKCWWPTAALPPSVEQRELYMPPTSPPFRARRHCARFRGSAHRRSLVCHRHAWVLCACGWDAIDNNVVVSAVSWGRSSGAARCALSRTKAHTWGSPPRVHAWEFGSPRLLRCDWAATAAYYLLHRTPATLSSTSQ